ncbi:hypothetical protein HT102_07000 [Hoyosella sp. G463]|uniref:Uncharacterized protein n=1 Tax=Lolliginicoccus lacisalsi TaxID=2742202 RepID=A0A927PM99_9ACTN|nr:hypothetical protein [Lolliginicoccus lacisalsi]MBD8506227.1 hypothetical protein [Lolliginicoccus lacisalsi]
MTGTATLVRLLLRLDRTRMAIWLLALPALVWLGARSIVSLYPTADDRAAYARTASEITAQIAMSGPPRGLDTIGGITVYEAGWLASIAVAASAILLGIRATRAHEDSGAWELILAGRIGPRAPLAAGAILVTANQLALGTAISLALVVAGADRAGSLVFGSAVASIGILFGMLGLLAAQVASNAPAARRLALGTLGIAFAVRAVHDTTDMPLGWASPLSWAQASEPFAGNYPAPLAGALVAAAALLALALAINARRDLGQGLLAARPGPASAGPLLGTLPGLQLRLARGTIIAWAVAAAITFAAFGSIVPSIDTIAGTSDGTAEVMAAYGDESLTEAFLAFSLIILAILAAGSSTAVALRLHADERASRLPLLAVAPLRRHRILAHYALPTLLAAVLTCLVGGIALALGAGASGNDWSATGSIITGGLVQAAPALVLGTLALALAAAAPRLAGFAWLAYAAAAIAAILGPVLRLPGWARDLTPFTHVADYPATGIPWVLLAISVALLIAAAMGLARRDITG